MRSVHIPALALVSFLAACSHVQLTDREQTQVQQRYRGQSLELAQSLWITPFYRDDSRRMLMRQRPEEDVMLVTPKGEPILPGTVEGVLPAGTHVTVLRVTFPNTWEYATRPLLTPRDRPWVEVAVNGRPSPAYVIILPPNLTSAEDVFDKVGDFLSGKAIDQEVATLPAADQHAITTKELSTGVSVRGLELAFGPANFRHIYGDGANRVEDWTWDSDTTKRTAHIVGGVVTSIDVRPENSGATAAK